MLGDIAELWQIGRNDKEMLQRRGDSPWTLNFMEKDFLEEKVCCTVLQHIFQYQRGEQNKTKYGGKMVSELAQCCPGKTERSHAVGASGT